LDLWGRQWLRIANDSIHDLAAGAWPGAVMALWFALDATRRTFQRDTFTVVLHAASSVWIVWFLALLLLVATGAARVNYRTRGLTAEIAEARTRAALWKHLIFVTVFVVATVAAYLILRV
jgi:putative copper export protein